MSVEYLEEPFVLVYNPHNTCGCLPGQNAQGYGSNISTNYMARIGNKLRRVYAICWSNAASHYIILNKQKLFLRGY